MYRFQMLPVSQMFITYVFFLIAITVTDATRYHWWDPPDSGDLILLNGYPSELHKVTTDDGYILTVFRIPYGYHEKPVAGKRPVLLQHGLMASSDCWLISTRKKSLAFVLADAGYDVWIGNNRGTSYSLEHVNMTSNNKQFWDYSFHELGYYDLPAMIDYIINKTGYPQIHYVAHSQGTTQFFTMASSRPEYNKKIVLASTLAPVAFVNEAEGLLAFLSKFAKTITFFSKIFGISHISAHHSYILSFVNHVLCRPQEITKNLCDDIFEIIGGFDDPQINKTLLQIAADYVPAGVSIKQLEHFSQLISNGGKFCQYDYGKSGNLKHYGSVYPPEYNLSLVTTPVALHYSNNDFLARPDNVNDIASLIKNVAAKIEVPDKLFNHLDFMWALDVDILLYKVVLHVMEKFN